MVKQLHNEMHNQIKGGLILMAAVLLFAGCSHEQDEMDTIRTADLPEISLTHLFVLDEPKDHFFQRITVIESDSEQRIFVVDQRAHKILVYDREGEYMTTIGGEGAGPDEFRAILRLIVDAHDRLLVFDMGNNRSVVYREDEREWEPVAFLTLDGTRFGVEAVDSDGNAIVRQSIDQMPEPGMSWFIHELAPVHLDSGLTGDRRVEFREMGSLVRDDMRMRRIPFGRTTLLARGNDGRYYMAWNESFDVEVYNMNLELIDSVSAPIPNLPVTSDERQEEIENAGERFRSLAREYMPETKPVARSMHVDDHGNFWLRTYDTPEYLVLGPEGNPIGSFDLGEHERLMYAGSDRIITLYYDFEVYEVNVYSFEF